MLEFIQAHQAAFSAAIVFVLDYIVNQLHPNPAVTSVINWILPFLRAKQE